MKKTKQIMVGILMCLAIPATAQKKAEPFIEIQPVIGLDKGSKASLQLEVGSTWKVHDMISLGFGAGIATSLKFEGYPSIPVFGRAKFNFGHNSITPFAMLDLGYMFNTNDFEYSSIIINPTVGVQINNYYLGIGYEALIPNKGELNNNINIKLGYQMTGDDGLSRFIKKSYGKVEVGYAIGSKKIGNDKKEITGIGKEAFARIIWMFPVSNQLEFGLGSGVDLFTPSEGQVVSIPLYARLQYDFPSVTNLELCPYISGDIGGKLSDEKGDGFTGFFFEPQVGITYNRWSAGIGVHFGKYEPSKYSELENCSSIGYSLRLGYRF